MYTQTATVFHYGVVGESGLVGKELCQLLGERTDIKLDTLSPRSFAPTQFYDALFLATPGTISEALFPVAKKHAKTIIDLSSAYRNDPNVPLIIPEINGHLLKERPQLIASPNCTATLLLLVLAPLHRAYKAKRVVVSSYQAASGAGILGLQELLENRPPKIFPHPYTNNVFLHESPRDEDNFCEEEKKVIQESRKILEDPTLLINIRCVRVPTVRAHALSVNIVFENNPVEAKKILENAPGILYDESPTPKKAEGKAEVLYGALRQDPTDQKGLDLWVCGDQLLKGAALNAVQIANQLSSIYLEG